MKLQHVVALLAVSVASSSAHAGIRTFTITDTGSPPDPAVTPLNTTLIFSYPDGAFASNDNVTVGELTSTFSIGFAGATGGSYQLQNIQHILSGSNKGFLMTFVASDTSKLVMLLNNTDFVNTPSGQDMPDSVEGSARTNYFGPGPSSPYLDQSFPSVTIGTAVPEPSAFGFGALALAATGVGQWVRRRFFVA
jgi:hypothetical protein